MFNRKKFLIKKGLQLRYTGLILFGMISTGILAGLFIYLQVLSNVVSEFSEAKVAQKIQTAERIREYDTARYKLPGEPPIRVPAAAKSLSAHEQEAVLEILRRASIRLIPSVAVLILVVALGSILISHRIAGPLYRLEKLAGQVKDGDLTVRFELRPRDELKGLAASLDGMARSLNAKVCEAAKLANEIKESPSQQKVTRLAEILSSFKVERD